MVGLYRPVVPRRRGLRVERAVENALITLDEIRNYFSSQGTGDVNAPKASAGVAANPPHGFQLAS
jgi:hypothetical protein